MSSNGITAKEACEIYRNSEQPDILQKALKDINESIEFRAKSRKQTAAISLRKEDISPDYLELILVDLKSRGFDVEHREHQASYYLDVKWC